MSFTIHLEKESFKFSSTHFTIFSKDRAERLHGHNYQLTCDIELEQIDPLLGMGFDFNVVKPEIKSLCDEVDERILIAAKSPFLKVKRIDDSIEVVFAQRRYLFPRDDCKELDLVNITSEELAKYFCAKLWARIENKIPKPHSLQITIEETLGQSVSYKLSL